MKRETIYFFKESIRFPLLNQDALRKWVSKVIRKESYTPAHVNFIFCPDQYLLKINKEYLQHNYFTDIITFDNSTEKKKLEADIFISVPRIKANAKLFKTSFQDELHRVMIHGI